MDKHGVKKIPGMVDVTVRGEKGTHLRSRWVANDIGNKDWPAIEHMIVSMFDLLKKNGYIVDPHWLLQEADDVDECFHGEMLAITWGLVHSSPHTPIYLSKNLRICGNCHEASKLISKLYGRDVYARDANRHHHVSEGKCSCGDYW